MATTVQCALCHKQIPPHTSYVVRIEVFAHPSTPAMDTDTSPDTGMEIDYLMDQLKHYSAEELQDQVYRKLEFHLCPTCQPIYLANPLGLPRKRKPGRN